MSSGIGGCWDECEGLIGDRDRLKLLIGPY